MTMPSPSLRRLSDEATPGPWLADMDSVLSGELSIAHTLGDVDQPIKMAWANAAFIVAAVSHVRAGLEAGEGSEPYETLVEISALVGHAFDGTIRGAQALDAIDDIAKASLAAHRHRFSRPGGEEHCEHQASPGPCSVCGDRG